MKLHLEELQVLLGRRVAAEELLSLEQTEQLRQASQHFRAAPITAYEIDFCEKMTGRFHALIDRLAISNPSPVYLWATYSVECGTLAVPSLHDIHFDFDFAVGDMELLSMTTSDFQDRLLLNWFESDDGARRLSVQTQGKHWAAIKY
ncbi:hypothetical protein [Variovorax sp. KK3]|uniref:hypothetical protein n=1 Tax=Variovorax sp. KK3 TaxID=1855728 RepID=UPI001180D7B4|nr:hypothetical protein [Variovorax sp. KK3]